MTAPRLDHYDWAGGREAMLRFGPEGGPTVLAALPLFEEANRTRASLVAVLRRLAVRGIGSALPDLPGTNDSLVSTENATLADWRAAFAAAALGLPQPVHVVGWRGGVLVNSAAGVTSRWHLSPVTGAAAVRELRRVRAASGGGLYAGNCLSEAMLGELERSDRSTTGPIRTVRLESDPSEAEARLPGRPLWRAAEPDADPVLEEAIAADIAEWITRCVG